MPASGRIFVEREQGSASVAVQEVSPGREQPKEHSACVLDGQVLGGIDSRETPRVTTRDPWIFIRRTDCPLRSRTAAPAPAAISVIDTVKDPLIAGAAFSIDAGYGCKVLAQQRQALG